MPNPEPHVDLTKIDFPSDGISFKHLRRIHADLFDRQDGVSGFFDHLSATELEPLVSGERRLARHAFNAALGRQEPEPHGGWEEERQVLSEILVCYGLAGGPHQAEQLIRGFEQAAAEQAKKHTPTSPRR
jgi:hypothetical protein